MIDQLVNNWLCWAILFLALVCYYQLWAEYLNREGNPELKSQNQMQKSADALLLNDNEKHEYTGTLIGALPLMGLLGTIIGLLDCFAGIASDGASGELVSSGIADALLTTQLGLVCAIPAWLLQAWVRRTSSKAGANASITALQAE